MRRRDFIAVMGSSVALPIVARAQPALPVIGYLSTRSLDAEAPVLMPFLEALEKSGFSIGRNISIEYRYADGQEARLPALAAELVARNAAVLVALGRPTALAAKAATSSIPIVFGTGVDPVSDGLVTSLNRPGGNATGISLFTTQLGPKRLSLLRELLPQPGTIAFVVDPGSSTTPLQIKEMSATAEAVGQSLLIIQASTVDQLAKEFSMMAERKVAAILYGTSQHFQVISKQLIALADLHRIPAIYEWRDFVTAGGLMSYSTERTEFARQAAIYVARILEGHRPAELPVLQSARFEMVINIKTAKALGIDLPPNLIARADAVIE